MTSKELQDLIDSLDFGPIEQHVRALGVEPALPERAVIACTILYPEAGAALRAVLERAANGEPLSEEDERQLFRGLHIMGGARDAAALPLLLRLLRRPRGESRLLRGDIVTETLPRIVIGLFDGDTDALFETIADVDVDEFIRDALLGAAAFLVHEGRIERGKMRDMLTQFYERRAAPDDDYAWIGWLEAIAILGFRDLAPLAERAWNEERIPAGITEWRYFEQDLEAAEQAADAIRFEKRRLGYITDTLETLRGWEHNDAADSPRDVFSSLAAPVTTPVVNPWRHVGRNDPCPCGSGKKAKKCCLAAPDRGSLPA